MRVDEYTSVMQDQFFTIRAERYVLPLKASAKSLGLGIVHDTSRTGRDGVRRAHGAGRGQQPAEGHRAGHPPRVAPHPGGADRRRRRRWPSRCAGRRRCWRALDVRLAARAARGSPTAAAPSTSSTRRSSSCAPRATRCSRCRTRRRRDVVANDIALGGDAAADPGGQRAERRRQDGADEDRRAGGADGARRAAGGGRARAAASASSTTCAPTSAIASR